MQGPNAVQNGTQIQIEHACLVYINTYRYYEQTHITVMDVTCTLANALAKLRSSLTVKVMPPLPAAPDAVSSLSLVTLRNPDRSALSRIARMRPS